ncbi:THAP domain-containing protein 1-like isoform X1 [Photinus pyralis]|uniref:THAP domain-containing protein 1-like isoform X1 n=1 Tax=Photinus pyralis TaxID=7054 RepID=UPI001267170B|nr:THAP domain-containing protein 1-like isoform X1 [Photinus pyralis]
MVKSCVAFKCTNRNSKSVSFHRFPTDNNLMAQWIRAIGREKFTPTKHSVICGEHFKEADFLRKVPKKVLKNDAIPSVFDFPVQLKVESPKQHRTIIPHPLPARTLLLKNTQSDDCDADPIPDTEEPSTSSSSRTSLKRKLYFGDYSEEDLQCPKKAKMMWKLA